MIVQCPTCKKPVEWSEKNPWRPFCSERCKLIDLGEWASDSYVIRGNSYEQTNETEADKLAQELSLIYRKKRKIQLNLNSFDPAVRSMRPQ